MCFWNEIALFNCDGTVERQKYLCDQVPQSGSAAGAQICKDHEDRGGCPHSQTDRPIPHQAIFRHVCDRDAWQPPARSGIRWKFTPVIREPFSVFATRRPGDGGKLKDGLQFRWCDGSVCSVEEVFGKNAGEFRWRGVDLLQVGEEEVCRLVGKGTYEHWVAVWSGERQKAEIGGR